MTSPNNFSVKDRTILITGGSSGFGLHFANMLAARGANVVLAARRIKALEAAVRDIGEAGGHAKAIELDVTQPANVAQAIADLPTLHVVVNNAGISGESRAIDCEADEWRSTFDVNVNAAFEVSRCAARRMREQGQRGSIINIASITGVRPGAGAAAYSASKAAVIHMTKALAAEWARYGVRINAIAPGYFETDLTREFLASDFGKQMRNRIPQRRFGELAELDGPLLLLASDASSYMTGSVIAVDGGHLSSHL